MRANENVELTALQTLFLRNHNAIATGLAKSHPNWSGSSSFIEESQQAQYRGSIRASFTTNGFPPCWGKTPYPALSRLHNPNVNATIANEFLDGGVSFSGHSLVSPEIEREGNNGQDINTDISLAYDFFDPNFLSATPQVDPLTGETSTDIGTSILKGDADGKRPGDGPDGDQRASAISFSATAARAGRI